MRRHKIDGSGEMHLSALKLKRGLESFISRLRPKSPKEVLPELWYINSFLSFPHSFFLFFDLSVSFFFLPGVPTKGKQNNEKNFSLLSSPPTDFPPSPFPPFLLHLSFFFFFSLLYTFRTPNT